MPIDGQSTRQRRNEPTSPPEADSRGAEGEFGVPPTQKRTLAYMNTARWNAISTADREGAVRCPCGGGMQHVEHVMSECEHTLPHLDEMIQTVGEALQSEREDAQSQAPPEQH